MKTIYYLAEKPPIIASIKRVFIVLVVIFIVPNITIKEVWAQDIEVHQDNAIGTSSENVIIADNKRETYSNFGTLTSNTPADSHWGMLAQDGGSIFNGYKNVSSCKSHNKSCVIINRGFATDDPNYEYGTKSANRMIFVVENPSIKNTLIGNVGQIDSDFKASMFGSGVNTYVANDGIIGDKSINYQTLPLPLIFNNYGMVAVNEAHVYNEGGIYTSGSYGMVAIGRYIAPYISSATTNAANFNRAATNISNNGIIKNAGFYGMLTLGGASGSNSGEIQNSFHAGMLAYGTGSRVINNETGIISNLGSYGMAAVNGAYAKNMGIIKTYNDKKAPDQFKYGMIAEGQDANGHVSLAINLNLINNTGSYGLVASYGATAINDVSNSMIGKVQNGGDYGIMAFGANSEAKNKGEVSISGIEGGSAQDGGTLINYGSIKSAAPVLHATGKGSIIENFGQIDATASSKGTPVIAEEGTKIYNYRNGVITYAATDIGVKLDKTDFFNSGSILPDSVTTNNIAIQMYQNPNDNYNSILELGGGTHVQGEIDAGLGEDTLVFSGKGDIRVENGEVINFEKAIAINGNTTLYGVYKLNLSSVPTYSTHAFETKTFDTSDNKALGSISIAGELNLVVDYDDIINSTTNSSKVLAGAISLKDNGSVNLINVGSTTDDIVTTAIAHDNGLQAFDLDNIILVSSPIIINPNFYTVSGPNGIFNPNIHKDWISFTVGDQATTGGSISINQRFEKKPDAVLNYSSAKKKINNDKNVVIYQKEPASYILVPRNRVDLDKYYQLSDYVSSLSLDNGYSYHSSNNTVSFRELTSFAGEFKSKANYNYDYGTSGTGFMFGLKHKNSNIFQTGFGFLYDDTDVRYHGLILNNVYVGQKGNTYHKENIKSFGSTAYADYSYKSAVISLGLETQFSSHNQKITFSDGKSLGKYRSGLLGSNLSIAYNINSNKDLQITPSLGLKYIHLDESEISYNNKLKVSSITSNALIGIAKLSLSNSLNFFNQEFPDKISWELSATLKHRLTNKSLHEKRKLVGSEGFIYVHRLTYSHNEFDYFASVNYRITPFSTLRFQYEKAKNANKDNNTISLELIHNL